MRTLTVYDLVHYLKNELDNNPKIQDILVSGEISNFNHHFSGHLYFSLKDERSRISCVMFKGNASRLYFEPKNGDKVIIRANTSIFEAGGQMQLYVLEMRPDGLGELYLRFEALKKALGEAGYFLQDHKIAVTSYPMHVAVLVGDKSAALSDIKTCFKRRWPIAKVDIYPCLVQGEGSVEDIIANLIKVDKLGYDAIILARGGGSIEDLWSFNDERLAKTIYDLKTFIITGIGHEQDFTIADFVADLRAPTPTAAVELITPNISDVDASIKGSKELMVKAFSNYLAIKERSLVNLKSSIVFKNPYYLIERELQTFDNLTLRLVNYTANIKKLQSDVDLMTRDMRHALSKFIGVKINDINRNDDALRQSMRTLLYERSLYFKRMSTLLEAYGFDKTFKRGFSIVKKEGKVVKKGSELKVDDIIDVTLYKGSIKACIKEVRK